MPVPAVGVVLSRLKARAVMPAFTKRCGNSAHLLKICFQSKLLLLLPPTRLPAHARRMAMATTLAPLRSALLAPTMARATRTPAHSELAPEVVCQALPQ
jgi:hypothetical protein